MTDSTKDRLQEQKSTKLSMLPDWAVNVYGYTCFVGALAAEGLLMVYTAVAGEGSKKRPSPLANFMGNEP